MRSLLGFIITAVYTLSSGITGQAMPSVPSIKIQVKHNHLVIAGHSHHHDFANDARHNEGHDVGAGASQKHDHSTDHKESVPHSHEVSVPMINAYVASSMDIIHVTAIELAPLMYFAVYDDSRPEDISLRSIFRPPIYA